MTGNLSIKTILKAKKNYLPRAHTRTKVAQSPPGRGIREGMTAGVHEFTSQTCGDEVALEEADGVDGVELRLHRLVDGQVGVVHLESRE